MKPYPLTIVDTIDNHTAVLRLITRFRQEDIGDFTNLQNVFMAGRKVGKVPTGSADVTADDRVGDFNYSTTFLYILVDNAGTATWRRVALAAW